MRCFRKLCRFVFNCMCASSGLPGRQINDACAISAQLSLILASSQFYVIVMAIALTLAIRNNIITIVFLTLSKSILALIMGRSHYCAGSGSYFLKSFLSTLQKTRAFIQCPSSPQKRQPTTFIAQQRIPLLLGAIVLIKPAR